MKKTRLFIAVLSLSLVAGLTACKGGKGEQKEAATEEKEEAVDYAALVEKELPSIEDFVKVVDVFQQCTRNLETNAKTNEKAGKAIRELLEPKGFTVEQGAKDGHENFFSATKNCRFVVKEENYVYSFSMEPGSVDSLAAAVYFECMGDFYEKGEIILADTCVYDAVVEKIKAAGYQPATEHVNSEKETELMKDNYYFLCNREDKRIALHYDFMKAQGVPQ